MASGLGIFGELMDWVAGRFPRAGTRRRARVFVLGLLADLPRKNCWYLLAAGHGSGDFRPSLRAVVP